MKLLGWSNQMVRASARARFLLGAFGWLDQMVRKGFYAIGVRSNDHMISINCLTSANFSLAHISVQRSKQAAGHQWPLTRGYKSQWADAKSPIDFLISGRLLNREYNL